MTTTMGADQIVKVDRIGRIKTPRERREALLAEFDQSGMSGQQFAKWAGIKYGTFITWVQKRRKVAAPSIDDKPAPAGAKSEVRWVEAIMENGALKKSTDSGSGALIVQGASGVRLELSEERHVLWAAKLLRHLEVPGPC
jgi:transposase